MNLFTEASLSDSAVFQQLNKSSNITAKAVKAIQTGTILEKDFIEDQYLQMSKTRISPIVGSVVKAFDDGEIKLIYNKEIHLTTAVPFIVINLGGRPTGCIFIGDFSGVTKDGTALNIDMKKLYTIMESAFIAVRYFSRPELFTRNTIFLKIHAQIYSAMVLRILNREYALSLDKDVYDSINYMAARFCLEHIMGVKNPELSHSYAVSVCNNPSNVIITIARDNYMTEDVTSIEKLVALIAKQSTKMEKLTYRYFFERWISSFGTGACLGIDSYPYLSYIISNVLLGAFLVNVTGLSEIVKNTKGINSFYMELSRII